MVDVYKRQSELFAECVALTHYKVDIKQEDVDNVMTRILLMHDEFVSRISHTEPGNVKGFYKKLRMDFNAQAVSYTHLDVYKRQTAYVACTSD